MTVPRLSLERITTVAQQIIRSRHMQEDDTAVALHDLTFIQQRAEELTSLFPKGTLHAIAVKANPLAGILKVVTDTGMGLEVASHPELFLAQQISIPSDRIVFDSPVKTRAELSTALKAGVRINADSFDELERIEEILKTTKSGSPLGVRVNPQVGTGKILATSVAGEYSKFGIPLDPNRVRLLECYERYSWLNGIHVHIGSQSCPAEMLVKGINRVVAFMKEVNGRRTPNCQMRNCDIGGGLQVRYRESDRYADMQTYVAMLQAQCPELFSPDVQIITEFGRYIFANAGWVISRVEYVKKERTANTIMTHVGADLLLRKCYNPRDWHHDIALLNSEGRLKSGPSIPWMIAGPLCFAGDILGEGVLLPEAVPGDYLIIRDTGAYTLSMWSRYNSRQMPKVIGYRDDGKSLIVLKDRENLDDVARFWK